MNNNVRVICAIIPAFLAVLQAQGRRALPGPPVVRCYHVTDSAQEIVSRVTGAISGLEPSSADDSPSGAPIPSAGSLGWGGGWFCQNGSFSFPLNPRLTSRKSISDIWGH